MNTDVRNSIAELILKSLKNPEDSIYIDILDFYCSHVDQWKSLKVPITILQQKVQFTKKDLDPLLHCNLFNLFLLEKENPPEDFSPDSTLCLNPDIESDFPYITQRANSAKRITTHLREHPIPSDKDRIEDGVIKAALLFNNQLYFETHEILEEIWLEEVGNIRPFLQGIIQIAVGFHHLLNGNYHGAISLTKDGSDKLRSYSPHHCGLDVQSFLDGVHQCRQCLSHLNRDTIFQFDWSLVPEMKLVN